MAITIHPKFQGSGNARWDGLGINPSAACHPGPTWYPDGTLPRRRLEPSGNRPSQTEDSVGWLIKKLAWVPPGEDFYQEHIPVYRWVLINNQMLAGYIEVETLIDGWWADSWDAKEAANLQKGVDDLFSEHLYTVNKLDFTKNYWRYVWKAN